MHPAILDLSIVGILLFLLVPSIVNWLKGKRLWAILGFPTGWHWVPVFRLAKPDSWWARRFYDEEQLIAARVRFQTFTAEDPLPPVRDVDAIEELTADEIRYHDKITQKAWRKAQKEGRVG
jgi:hypothetical protein